MRKEFEFYYSPVEMEEKRNRMKKDGVFENKLIIL